MTAAFIFGLLIAMMLTGMPISIALGLTVLTFLYTMTQVPIESVALKLCRFAGTKNASATTEGGASSTTTPVWPPPS